jgi:hypothetical protein
MRHQPPSKGPRRTGHRDRDLLVGRRHGTESVLLLTNANATWGSQGRNG